VVDDEPGILDVMSRGLRNAGFEISAFSSGREFERAVVRDMPEHCVMDLSLPDVDGVTILNELVAQDYRGRIVLISGHSQQLLRSVRRLAEDYQLQIVGCVHKPFTMAPLLNALSALPVDTFMPTHDDVLAAMRDEQLIVRYQPIVDLTDRQVVAAEALVRWQHPTAGLLPPSRFLPQLDHDGMIALTTLVLRNVFQNRATWSRQNLGIILGVNVPTPVAADMRFSQELSRLMELYQTDLTGITFEITENEMVADVRGLASMLSALCLKGARVALDDFGTGFSSLTRMQCLPIDDIKIDKSFIRHCTTHAEDRKIVKAVIALSHALDMKVVAEGVENETTAALLTELGCDFGQGFLFGSPVSASELTGLLLPG